MVAAIVQNETYRYISCACNIMIVCVALTSLRLLYMRRNEYPVRVAPFWLQASGQFGVPLCMFALTYPMFVYTDPGCFLWWFFYPVLAWIPCVSTFIMLMWWVQIQYAVQCIRMKKPMSLFWEKFYLWSSHTPNFLLQYFVVAAMMSGPLCIISFAEYRRHPDVCRPQETPTLIAYYTQPLIITIVAVAIGYRMRTIQEEFNLTKNFAKIVINFCVIVQPWRLVNMVFGEMIPSNILMHTQFIEMLGWFLSLLGYAYWSAFKPYRASREYGKPSSSTLKIRPAGQTSSGSSKRHEQLDVKASLKDEAVCQNFRIYCMGEFCVENMLFLDALQDPRLTKADIVTNFLTIGCANEINVSNDLRQSQDLAKCEEEVYRLLQDPFQRFYAKLGRDPKTEDLRKKFIFTT